MASRLHPPPMSILPAFPLFLLLLLLFLCPSPSSAMFSASVPECAKPGFDMGVKSGAGLGGVGAAAYTGLMSMCPGLMPHLMAGAGGAAAMGAMGAAGGGAAAAMGTAAAAGTAAATTGAAASTAVALPGLMMAGPMAPLAAMVTAGMVGGAMIGGAAGSMISCREVGVQVKMNIYKL